MDPNPLVGYCRPYVVVGMSRITLSGMYGLLTVYMIVCGNTCLDSSKLDAKL